MKFIADLHTHSRFSRATSKTLDPEHLSLWAQKKGIAVVGTGDFTHPEWISELGDKLIDSSNDGLYQLKPELQRAVDAQSPPSCPGPVRFLLTGEISCIYKKNGRTRKLHHLILMPDMEAVSRFNRRLDRIGNISSDGRPILGLDSKDLLEITLETSENAFFIPAHIWTPWFSLFGSKSGFDTIEECFEDLTGHIYALETGLSSDPPMNRRLSALDRYVLVSNSDAHSPGKLGREANLFETDLDYEHMIQAMKNGKGFSGTIEFFPEEGKYHLDGHRKCGVRLTPEETLHLNGICPVCKKPLTVGVLNRVYELSDRKTPLMKKDCHNLIPLPEILSELLGCGPATKKVTLFYERLLSDLGPELDILMDVPIDRLQASGGPVLAEAIKRMRCNQVIREEGYDGHFGTIHLFQHTEKEATTGQMALFLNPTPEVPTSPAPTRPQKKARTQRKTTVHPPQLPSDPILSPLNPEQKAAVLHNKGHLLIVAGPGTGKTMTLTHRMTHLIREGRARPEEVLALTFTRKAAREMGERISKLLSDPHESLIRVATFHRFCLDLLRKHGSKTGLPCDFALCSEADKEAIARDVLDRTDANKPSVTHFLKTLSLWRSQSLADPMKRPYDTTLLPLCSQYQHRLRAGRMLDLDELEVEALRALRDCHKIAETYNEKYPWIFVDEYQDTNPIQVEILKRLIDGEKGHLCAIGDPDQAIYGFRGADVSNFYRFAHDFPGAKEIVLTRNYRSTQNILQGSAAVIQKERPLISDSLGGGPIAIAPCRTESEEAEMIVEQVEKLLGGTSHFSIDSGRVATHEGDGSLGFGDISVLYRLNVQGDALEEALNRAGIPFIRSGETPLISKYPVNILWRYFQTLRYPDIPYYTHAFAQLSSGTRPSVQKRFMPHGKDASILDLLDSALASLGIDIDSEETHKTVERLRDLARHCEGDMASFLDTLSIERGIDHALMTGDRIALMSLHAAKGLEWQVTFITGCEQRLLPCLLFGNRDIEEERRLFYVGMTRARSHLILSHVNRRSFNGRVLHMKPSPFLELIPEDVCQPLHRHGWKPRKRPHQQMKLF
ncbi:MAG: UvrD-helicase domain-containing protein [Deltaproteobacteria bacterium]|nr:UvrD-helicase domain-containing protein [Deltaproteobacteria bacterium]